MEQKKIERMDFSMGLFVIYFGTKKLYKKVAHHTIWMGKRYKGLLKDIFNNQILAEDFSLYLHRPTATDPSMAPKIVIVFMYYPLFQILKIHFWKNYGKVYEKNILNALNRQFYQTYLKI